MFFDVQRIWIISLLTLVAFSFVRSVLFFIQIMHPAPWFPAVLPLLLYLSALVTTRWWHTLRNEFRD